MKRVSIGYIIAFIVGTCALCMIGTEVGVSLGVPLIIRMATMPVWAAYIYWLTCKYPFSFEKKFAKLVERKNIDGIGVRGDFFLAESYFIDTTNGYLIGLMACNPVGFQYLDLKDVDHIELVPVIFNQSVLASLRCRIHYKNKKFDIWIYRDARYRGHLEIGSKEELVVQESADIIKEKLAEAVAVAKSKRQ